MKRFLPRLFAKFEKDRVSPELYCSHWYMVMFAVYFPPEVVHRIWDIYLFEGPKTLFRISLAIMKINEEFILKGDNTAVHFVLKDYQEKVDWAQLFDTAFLKIKFSKRLVADLKREYAKNNAK